MEPLRQGEVLSNVIQLVVAAGANLSEPSLGASPKAHDLAVLVSQDCDLETDFRARNTIRNLDSSELKNENAAKKLLPCALFCEVIPAEEFLKNQLTGGDSADKVRKNNDFRYHCLQEVPRELDFAGEGIPALVVSFRRYFTVPMDDLVARIYAGQTRRRVCMFSPYFEHLSSRFAYYIGRIGLPADHKINS